MAGLGLLGYLFGPGTIEIPGKLTFLGIQYNDIFVGGFPFSHVLASLFFASLFSLGDSVLPKPSVQMRRASVRYVVMSVSLAVLFSVIAYLISIAHK
jgi:ABC-type transport system involved in cytochrome c biogenesis permease subunit